jgi:hypothetical protein
MRFFRLAMPKVSHGLGPITTPVDFKFHRREF